MVADKRALVWPSSRHSDPRSQEQQEAGFINLGRMSYQQLQQCKVPFQPPPQVPKPHPTKPAEMLPCAASPVPEEAPAKAEVTALKPPRPQPGHELLHRLQPPDSFLPATSGNTTDPQGLYLSADSEENGSSIHRFSRQ
ncbi:Ubiquitin Carboxyl-Terminal Hydrolase 12 [Manis pentadactyla]|nr:Ubiquitin Carboxyl-Terminal Hydrolase 12 [Manis pentadactyla]